MNATDRLYLAEDVPSLIVWGRRDPIIPVRHAGAAQLGMPGSRLEVFDDAGHFPQLDEPARFASTLADFVETTEPAEADADLMRGADGRRRGLAARRRSPALKSILSSHLRVGKRRCRSMRHVRDHLEARALARAKVRARRKRARTIRRRTAWFSAAVFGVTWLVIFGQLVGGHDPALARKRVAATATAPRTQAAPVREPRRQARPQRRHRRRHHHHVAAPTTAATTTAAPPPQAPAPAPVTTQAAPPPAPKPAPPPTPVVTQQS